MSEEKTIARHYATGQLIQLSSEQGIITSLEPAPLPAPGQCSDIWIAPPLVDLQINGYAGVDFQQDNLTSANLLKATRELRAAGCGSFCLTLITDHWPKVMARLRHLHALRSQSAELQGAIVGWHIEGPFLSSEPGFRGAHDPAAMIDPSPGHIRELRDLTGKEPVLLTVAPERPGAIAAISLAVSLGMKVSLGHTNATAHQLREAVLAGATGFTHLGNGCPRDLDRHDNILWRAFEIPELTVGLIPDGVHVSASFFRLVHRVVGAGSIYYTTDAMAAAGAPPGRYKIGRLDLEVGPDQIVRLPGTPNFAGSALQPIDGVSRAAEMLGCSWQDVWPHFSTAPGRFMGLPDTELKVGGPAAFCLIQTSPTNQIRSLKTAAIPS